MENETYHQIQQAVKKVLGIDLTHYKEQQMRRRLDGWLMRSQSRVWTDYLARLPGDLIEQARFRDFLTINVSAFFRDPDRWLGLEKEVLPRLLHETPGKRPGGELRLWSAGCSMGAEPFTMVMLLAEIARGRRFYLLATDLDRNILARARNGGPFTAEDLQNFTTTRKNAYFNSVTPPYFLRPLLAQRVTFREHNLLSDPFENDFDLIVCRNVMIYFNAESKNTLIAKFHEALGVGGVLFLGGAEIIPFPHQFGFRSCGTSFYEKI